MKNQLSWSVERNFCYVSWAAGNTFKILIWFFSLCQFFYIFIAKYKEIKIKQFFGLWKITFILLKLHENFAPKQIFDLLGSDNNFRLQCAFFRWNSCFSRLGSGISSRASAFFAWRRVRTSPNPSNWAAGRKNLKLSHMVSFLLLLKSRDLFPLIHKKVLC